MKTFIIILVSLLTFTMAVQAQETAKRDTVVMVASSDSPKEVITYQKQSPKDSVSKGFWETIGVILAGIVVMIVEIIFMFISCEGF